LSENILIFQQENFEKQHSATVPLVRKSGEKHTTLTKIENIIVIKPRVQTGAKIVKALDMPMEDLVK